MRTTMKSLLLIALWVHLVHGSMDTTVCTQPQIPPGSQQPMRPYINGQFEVLVACIIVNKNFTTEVTEYFDFSNNQGKIVQTDAGQILYAYYNYSSNEFIEITPPSKGQTSKKYHCTVSDLSRTNQRYLLGYESSQGKGHMYTAEGALHFGNGNEVCTGKTVVRNIRVQQWISCQYWKEMNASMSITWYFSDPNSWTMALGLPQTPVRAFVKGKIAGPNPHAFEHVYDFIHFKNYISNPRVFETPSGVSCPGRKNTKAFPKLSSAFSFSVEITDNSLGLVTYMDEWYDSNMHLNKYNYKPSRKSGKGEFGYRPLTEIHDFNTGMAYIIDNLLGNCSWQLIEQGNFDDVKIDPYTVRIKTSKEFFFMDTTGVTYEGVKKVRNMDANVWVGKRSTPNKTSGANSTLEWYFRTDTWTAMQDSEASFPGATPIQMRLTVPDLDVDHTYNIYNYVKAAPNFLQWDISACYINLNRRKFEFAVPGFYNNQIVRNEAIFKYAVLTSITQYTLISPLRVAKLRVLYMKDVHIRFEMLDVAPLSGDVIYHPKETPLAKAADILTSKVRGNRFAILFSYNKSAAAEVIMATPSSIQEYDFSYQQIFNNGSVADFSIEDESDQQMNYDDESILSSTPNIKIKYHLIYENGYTAGTMGGLAVGMLIVGSAIGAGVSYLVFK